VQLRIVKHHLAATLAPADVGGLAALKSDERDPHPGTEAAIQDSQGSCVAMRNRQLQVEAHVLYSAFAERLRTLARAVSRGEQLDEANDFSRLILNSRIVEIISPYDFGGALKVDSAHLRWLAEELRRNACAAFQSAGTTPREPDGALDAINHKLDLIAGQLARISTAPVDGCQSMRTDDPKADRLAIPGSLPSPLVRSSFGRAAGP